MIFSLFTESSHTTQLQKNGSSFKHTELVVSTSKPFTCSECNYSCSKKSNLNTDMATHSREKPFPCPVCSYPF